MQMASNRPFGTDVEGSGPHSHRRKRSSSGDDSRGAKRSRPDVDLNNGSSSTVAGSKHGRVERTGSFGFISDNSQQITKCSQETDDSDDSDSQSLLSGAQKSKTLESRHKMKSPAACSKSRRDSSENGEKQDSSATDQSVSNETPLPFSKGTDTSQVGAPPDATTSPKLQTKRIPSVQRDAETIAGILAAVQDPKVVEDVYNRLRALRAHPQRIEVVTNAVLCEQTSVANHEADRETRALMDDVEAVLKHLKKDRPTKTDIDPNRVFILLENSKDTADRVDQVIKTLMQENGTTPTAAPSERTLMDDVQALALKFPASDPNELYNLLEAADPSEDRLKLVTRQLEQRTNQTPNTTAKTSTPDATTSSTQDKDSDKDTHDVFLRDLDIVCQVFPDRDKNEIYALLESCPHQTTRVQDVIRRLMGVTNQASQDSVPIETDGLDYDPLTQIRRDLALLEAIVPDCDPNYLFEELESRFGEKDCVQDISARLLETRNYPRLKDRLEKEKQEARRKQLFDAEIDIEEFLQAFPEPRETFYDIASTVSEGYKQHVKVHLCNIFPMVHSKFITEQLEENNFHLTPTLRRLERVMQRFERGERRGCFRDSPRDPNPLPDIPDEYFYQEIMFARNEQRVAVHVEEMRREREARVAAAREAGALLTCTCCYEDELVEDDMLPCPDGHTFCRNCIRRMSLERIGQGLVVVDCLDGECKTEFDLNVLQKALPPKTFSMLLKKKQEEEVKAAGISDLETCPFCSFATIMPNHEDKVFSCLNPECFRQSCRLCKEPNHVPLRCEEVEKQNETRFRTALELRMTEAMLRTCPRCKKRFFKVEGCNYMTCTCGQTMCYVCQRPLDGSVDHPNDGRCNVNDMHALHQEEMMTAGRDVLQELKQDNPDANINLDPENIVGHVPPGVRALAGGGYDLRVFDDDDDDDDDDY